MLERVLRRERAPESSSSDFSDDDDDDEVEDQKKAPKASKTPPPKDEKTAMLAVALREKTEQLKKMGVMLEALSPLPGVNAENLLKALEGEVDCDARDEKIVQLAKKARVLSFALQKEKDESTKAKKKLQEALALLEKSKNHRAYKESSPRSTTMEEPQDVAMKKEVRHLGKVVADLRSQVSRLRDENGNLRRALVKEVGDGDDRVLDDGWRGRAQQIVLLKKKIQDLEEKKDDLLPKSEVLAMERQQKRFVDDLSATHARQTQDLKEARKKVEALRARTETLTKDCTKHKDHLKLLLEKTESDNALIDALRAECRALKHDLRHTPQPKDQGQIEVERTKLKRENARLELLLERKNIELNALRLPSSSSSSRQQNKQQPPHREQDNTRV